MTAIPKHPSDDALSALPGDTILFLNGDKEIDRGIVSTTMWVPSFKGGKIYSYELTNGTIVANDNVTMVIKEN